MAARGSKGVYRNIVNARGLRSAGAVAVDLVGDCPVTVCAEGNGIAAVSVPMTDALWASAGEALAARIREETKRKPLFRGGKLTVNLTKANRAAEEYEVIRAAVSDALASRAAAVPCPCCGRGECDMAAVVQGQYVRVHRRCYEARRQAEDARIASQGSYGKGLLGALLVAVLFAAAAILLVALVQKTYGYLFAVLPFAATVGYEKAHGRYGGGGMAASLGASAAGMVIYLYGVMFWMLTDAGYSLGTCFANILPIGVDVFSPYFLKERAFELLFYAVGIVLVCVMRPLSRKKLARQAGAVAALAHPLTEGGEDAAEAPAFDAAAAGKTTDWEAGWKD